MIRCRPPRVVPVELSAHHPTPYELRLMQTMHPRSALAKQARKRKGRAIVFFTVEEAVPEAIDDEITLPMSVD